MAAATAWPTGEQRHRHPNTLPHFLEDHLRASPAASADSPPPASAVLQSWSLLRRPSSTADVASALAFLSSHRRHLHLSPYHVSLLLTLLPSHPSQVALLLSSHFLRSPPSSPLPSLTPSPHSLLLLGAAGGVDRLCAFLEDNLDSVVSVARRDGLLPEALAGIGYGLVNCDAQHLLTLLRFFFRVFECYSGLSSPNLEDGDLAFRLIEWVVVRLVADNRIPIVELIGDNFSVERCEDKLYPLFAVVMACCGALKASRLVSQLHQVELHTRVRGSLERTVSFVGGKAVSEDCNRMLCQFVAFGLARCGQISFNASVLRCICLALLEEILPLPELLRSFARSDANIEEKIRCHQDSILFKEAGSVTGILCNQYSSADRETKIFVENQVWEYSQQMYQALRVAAIAHPERGSLLAELEKMAESAFLMVVVFAAEVSKAKLISTSSPESQTEAAVRILIAFSCIEYMRRVRIPEYTETVRHAVLTVQGNAVACTSFIESMPAYAEFTKHPVGGDNYLWHKDDVQTARLFFYLRVVPFLASLIPASVFARKVAPTMFLYLHHTNEKVARASHSVMESFLSSTNETDQDERLNLKEQLTFFYLRRSLEKFPGVTPFDGVSSGVVALSRNLSAGSPATFFCIHSLVEKAKALCLSTSMQDPALWSLWEGSTEPCKEVTDLLLRLIFLVDIQSLPYLLKQLAELMADLPKEGKNRLLDDLHAHIAESDDVTRKPVLVSWLQSLSYISSRL